MESNESFPTIDQAIAELEALKKRVEALEATVAVLESLPKTGLLSHNFLTRAFAVFGLNLAAGFMIMGPFYLLGFVLLLVTK
jgi:hypothetical protein